MKKLAAIAAVALGGAFLCGDALAWGADGHRAIGAIADRLIAGSHAQQRVAALLQPGESLEQVAYWADCIKPTVTTCGPPTPEMQAYAAANPGNGTFHYTDVPFQLPHYSEHGVGTRADDVVQVLRQTIAVLQGRDDSVSNPHRFTPRQALLVLAHMAGDIHQPLHVGSPYVGKAGGFVVPEDRGQIRDGLVFPTRGGQDLLVDERRRGAATPSYRSLHAYWDYVMVEDVFRHAGARSPSQFAQIAIDGKPVVGINMGAAADWPYQWADESLAAARRALEGVVPGPMQRQTDDKGEMHNVWPVTLPPHYRTNSAAVVRARLTAGGYHLAALLQAIWP